MLQLYGSQGAGSAAIECALQHCNLQYTVVRASTWDADSAQSELAQVNPLGQIPTLVLEDGTVLTESAAILIHLALQHPGFALLPSTPSARATALRGLVFISSNCYAAISIGDYPERWTEATSKKQTDLVRQAARRQLHHHWDIFANTFKGQPFLSGTAPGALDYLAVVVSKWTGTRAHLQLSRPEFFETLKLIESQPVVAKVFAAHWPA
jgi:GST-like protein